MKKKTKDWLKEKLIAYLDEKNFTIASGRYTMSYRLGIVERSYDFKQHWDDRLEEYINQSITRDYDEEQSYLFLDSLIKNPQNNKDMLLEVIKAKSPANSTQIEKNGEKKKLNTSNELYEYRKKIIPLIKDNVNI